jgi:hypothetical protein
MLIYALALAQAAPTPLTETHLRDVGCVALLGIIADEQRREMPGANGYPDVREAGKRWAGVVGNRVMEQTGQPRELVALAIQQAVADIQAEQAKTPDAEKFNARFRTCKMAMDSDLAATLPLPKPLKAQ